jgi:beta-galactosidase GanA
MRVRALLAAVLLALSLTPAVPANAQRPPAHTVTYDDFSFSVDGQRTYLWSGEFHYYRLPSPDQWRDVLQKLKAGGFNAVSLYFSWAYHSPRPGVYDFSGVRDVDKLLDMAAEAGLYVIARPGPYINAEVDSGGFPGWLTTQTGRARSTAPDYLAAADEWLTQIDRIIKRHQLTTGSGSVITYQVENEFYDGSAAAREYMAHLESKVRADGITVPLVGNHNNVYNTGVGALDVDMPDGYPQGFNCSTPAVWRPVGDFSWARSPGKPLGIGEYQGGAFDPWGGPGYDNCRTLTGPDFEKVFYKNNIADGVTQQSFYMTYGGTSWGWQADPSQVYTSYDYGAAITEGRQLTAKYDEDKRLGYFVQAVKPLAKTGPLTTAGPTAPSIVDRGRINPDDHTQFHVLRHADSTSTSTDTTHIALDLGDGVTYPSVPQEPGTALTFAGRDSKILVANYALGGQRLRYSTSEIMTHLQVGAQDVALLYGRSGQAGETVLHYTSPPTVTVLAGSVRSTWDASGDLRLNYTHDGLARVLVSGGGTRPLLLLLGTDEVAATFWQLGSTLVRGPSLLRTATIHNATLALTGDTSSAAELEVFSTARTVTWNGRPAHGALGAPRPVTLPALTTWKRQAESPETQPGFDDSGWPVADKLTSASITGPGTLPVLFADDYGFHHGDVWYRGWFRGSAAQTGITLSAITGRAGAWSAWLNGTFLGSSANTTATFPFPAGTVHSGTGPDSDNVVCVLVENMGHNEDYNSGDSHKEARGLTGATLTGDPLTAVTWRLQGNRGGETPIDPVRGPMNNGGLYGERAGWSLPGFDDRRWSPVSLPTSAPAAGVTWYRTNARLDLPRGQDTSVGIRIDDDPARHYRAQIFVNGWQLGRYVNDVGPQHSFPIPNGILNSNGDNTIAIAVWNTDAVSGGLGKVSLESYGSVVSPHTAAAVRAPSYDARRYAFPPAPSATVSLATPDTVQSGQTFTATATVSRPVDSLTLAVPDGWTVAVAGVTPYKRIWKVTPVSGSLPAAAVLTATAKWRGGTAGDRRVVRSIPNPPTADAAVSALPFLSATNGWGPVERNTSNGEAAAGDGKPITLNGVGYSSGLGVHPAGDVGLYLDGHCTALSAVVGVDDETGNSGSVVFSVLADGKVVYTSPTLRGTDAGVPITVDVSGARIVDLVVGDSGDGNGLDHADWADARLTCG